MPITSQAGTGKYVPQSIETHAIRIKLREQLRTPTVQAVTTGVSRAKTLRIILIVGTIVAAAGGGAAAAAVLLTQNNTSSTTSSTSLGTTTTGAGSSTTTAAGLSSTTTTVGTGTTTTTGAGGTTASATTTGTTTTGGTTVNLGPQCYGLAILTSISQAQAGPTNYLDEQLSVVSNQTLTNSTITIYSRRNAGVAYSTCAEPILNFACSATYPNLTYIKTVFKSAAGQTVPPGGSGVQPIVTLTVPTASYTGSGDVYVVTATCGGGTSIYTGTF